MARRPMKQAENETNKGQRFESIVTAVDILRISGPSSFLIF